MFDDLTDDNFMIYALKCYSTPDCIISEFNEDFNRIKYIKRLFRKYKDTGDLKERLILNHIIVLGNVFGPEAVSRILFYKIDEEDYPLLKSFLTYLNLMPKLIRGIRGKDYLNSSLTMDFFVAKRLRAI